MLIRDIHIRDWEATFLFSVKPDDVDAIEEILTEAGAPDSIVRRTSKNVFAGRLDEGFCYSNPSLRCSVIGIGDVSSGPEFLNTTVHEVAHLALHIAENDGIDPYSEELAYLIGDITYEISDIVCEMSCPHCNGY